MAIQISSIGSAVLPNRNFTSLIGAHSALRGWYQPSRPSQVGTPLDTITPRAGADAPNLTGFAPSFVAADVIPLGGHAFAPSATDDIWSVEIPRDPADTHWSVVFGFKHNPVASEANDDNTSPFDLRVTVPFALLNTRAFKNGNVGIKLGSNATTFSGAPAASTLAAWDGWCYGIISGNATNGARVSSAGGAVSAYGAAHIVPQSATIGCNFSPNTATPEWWNGHVSDLMFFSGGAEADLHASGNATTRAIIHSYFRTIFGERF